MENPVIIIGANGVGRAALEIFTSHDIIVYGFLDDNEGIHNTLIDDVSVLGFTDDDGFLSLVGKKCEVFVATDETELRRNIVESLNGEYKAQPTNAVHQSAQLASSASIGHGNFINTQAAVGAGAKLGNHNLIHSSALLDYEVQVGDFVQVGAGAVLNAGVTVEDGAFIGSGATVVAGVKIGEGARIGAGSVVVSDVKKGEVVFGNPAASVKK
ncbi:MAG: acetyltransferase [Cytophagales bacterium]|nr:acetyltransferase [Cytophagales bacterium]